MFQQKKPFSAVTVTIENLTAEAYEEDDFSGIPDLVEVIGLQATGPSEAARALRKKLKYGNVHRQLRALVILDGLVQNAGDRFQRNFLDEPLLERLRVCGTSDLSDPAVKAKCRELFRGWAAFGKTPGLQKLARLHKELPKRKAVVTQERSKVLQETEANPFGDEEEAEARRAAQQRAAAGSPSTSSTAAHTPAAPAHKKSSSVSASSSSSFFGSSHGDKKKDKDKAKGKRKPFDLQAEKEQMKSVIADSSIATTNLMNALQIINRETERISDNQQAVQHFEACKQLRRRVLRYIHNVEDEQWLGGLLHANDTLVHALMSFEQMDRSIDADSDSDDELAEQAHLYRMATAKGKEAMASTSPTSSQPPDLAGLSIGSSSHRPPAPPRPAPASKPAPPSHQQQQQREAEDEDDDDDDDDNPFADRNVVETPAVERGEPRW
ncbi:hypothetical protein S7711_05225 [Stachybotrys chartarum IBT 7711]|uniref:VHS domain-containing protein n=1 Tax=Stachybotrys chartarum (strain CBS 109288 / IBT 7711) TaxID=1280523 RepID=A0A084ANJ2_STACB|nr:hypothetical protein S7711_05225 [Stachybotrys chartarum IBT 7711]